MRKSLILIVLSLFCSPLLIAQTTTMSKRITNPADVESVDAIIKSVYEIISGDAGVKRDWDRFRTLFHKDARLIPTGKNNVTGLYGATDLTPDEYITRSGPYLEGKGFHEKEIGRQTITFGNIVHLFSAYEGRNSLIDSKPLVRGINSIQLLNDGKRWWIMTIFWQEETPENPLPKEFLKFNKD